MSNRHFFKYKIEKSTASIKFNNEVEKYVDLDDLDSFICSLIKVHDELSIATGRATVH